MLAGLFALGPDKAEAKRKTEADIKGCLEAERKDPDSGQLIKVAISHDRFASGAGLVAAAMA